MKAERYSLFPYESKGRKASHKHLYAYFESLPFVGYVNLKRFGLLLYCGKFLRASSTTCLRKDGQGTRLIAEPNGKNEEDWIIRTQCPYARYARVWERVRDFTGKCWI
jgi:hypothetical protein